MVTLTLLIIRFSIIFCHFTKVFITNVIQWFNNSNNSHFSPSIKETLFGMLSSQYGKKVTRKFNYALLFMRYYIYSRKLHSQAITLEGYKDDITLKYQIESFS